jgi:hypothetical protein
VHGAGIATMMPARSIASPLRFNEDGSRSLPHELELADRTGKSLLLKLAPNATFMTASPSPPRMWPSR